MAFPPDLVLFNFADFKLIKFRHFGQTTSGDFYIWILCLPGKQVAAFIAKAQFPLAEVLIRNRITSRLFIKNYCYELKSTINFTLSGGIADDI